MRRVLSQAVTKRWSTLSGSTPSRPTSPENSESFELNPKTAIGLSFGSHSNQGKYHKNEDCLVKVTSLASGLEQSADESFAFGKEVFVTGSGASENPAVGLSLSDVYYSAVFDGHGGNECADFLARTLHVKIAQEAADMGFSTFQELCSSSMVSDAFKACEDEYQKMFAKSMAGSCALVCLIHDNSFLLAWVGDCRAVLYTGDNVLQLTQDHRTSNTEEHKRIVENGGVVLNDRVLGVLSPSRAFGNNDIKRRFPGVVSAEPTVLSFTIDEAAVPSEESFLVLASDGVFDAFSNHAVCNHLSKNLQRGASVEEAAKRLVESASRVETDDMTTSVIVWNHQTRRSTSGRSTSSCPTVDSA